MTDQHSTGQNDQGSPGRPANPQASSDVGERSAVEHPASSFVARHRNLLICLSLFVLVLGTFFSALHNDFVRFDDPDDYVTTNVHVRNGLTWENVVWSFGSTAAANSHPLTWLSHMLDCEIFGLAPWGHHLTSILLHAVNTILVFLVLQRMTGSTWRSFFVAALFGVHPLRVESVAWIAERKDVRSTAFWIRQTGLSQRGYR